MEKKISIIVVEEDSDEKKTIRCLQAIGALTVNEWRAQEYGYVQSMVDNAIINSVHNPARYALPPFMEVEKTFRDGNAGFKTLVKSFFIWIKVKFGKRKK